jgi:hypothetical protein
MSDNITPSSSSSLPPAGWYADPHDATAQRYWDGARWTEQIAAAAAVSGGAIAVDPKSGLRKLSWWQWALLALAALVLIAMIGGAIGGANRAESDSDAPVAIGATPTTKATNVAVDEPDTTVAVPNVGGLAIGDARALIEDAGFTFTADATAGDDWIISAQTPASGVKAEPGTAVSVTAAAPEPVLSLEQQNALREAQSYLDYSDFSRQGLIDQMSSEYGAGYPLDVATWAVDAIGADWYAEAVESAQSYLDYSSFSRQALFDQLTSAYGAQFTADEANHALAAVGY